MKQLTGKTSLCSVLHWPFHNNEQQFSNQSTQMCLCNRTQKQCVWFFDLFKPCHIWLSLIQKSSVNLLFSVLSEIHSGRTAAKPCPHYDDCHVSTAVLSAAPSPVTVSLCNWIKRLWSCECLCPSQAEDGSLYDYLGYDYTFLSDEMHNLTLHSQKFRVFSKPFCQLKK